MSIFRIHESKGEKKTLGTEQIKMVFKSDWTRTYRVVAHDVGVAET